MSGVLEVTILGCGSSGGVPRADGNWGDCDPAEPRNYRTRCSLMVRRKGEGPQTTLVVDTSPDFRGQAAANGMKRLDAVLLTHDHADQTHGLDDVRAFALNQRARIPTWMDEDTCASLLNKFRYIFQSEGGYPAICEVEPIPPHGTPWSVGGPTGDIPVTTFDLGHGAIRSVGYRFGPVAYCPDVDVIPDEAFEALAGVQVWIVDALRWAPHPTHAHVERALDWIARVAPARAILTDMHIDMDYRSLLRDLPAGVEPAFDGMRFDITL